jgi:Ser/Thr protein kinase RdoA (MazF antagonist)
MAASVRAYVDRPITDLAAATAAARLAARQWGLAAPGFLRVGMNAIFVTGNEVLRVSTPTVPASASLELASFLADAGLRVPTPARDDVVVVGELSVTSWVRLEPVGTPVDWSEVGEMVRTVHTFGRSTLPDPVPLPIPSSFPWWDFEVLLERTAAVLDDSARRGIASTIERHRGWRALGGPVVCHGDVHPGNVVMTADGATLIDWDLLCWAPPGWDHGPMLTWASRWGGDGHEYPAFAAGYGRSLADDPAAIAVAELRLVAATLMRLDAGLADPAAMPEAQLRLRYWRGDDDAPPWTAQ